MLASREVGDDEFEEFEWEFGGQVGWVKGWLDR